MTKITFDIMYTPYTIDTYNMFTMEHEEENICSDMGVNIEYKKIK